MLLLSSLLQIPIHVGAFKLVTNLGSVVGAFKFVANLLVANPNATIVAFKLATNLIVANCDVTLKLTTINLLFNNLKALKSHHGTMYVKFVIMPLKHCKHIFAFWCMQS